MNIMDAIRRGDIRMRPRWHFVLLSTLSVLGVLIVFLALLYIASLAVFFLRDSGVWFTPTFGPRGWFSLLRSLPWLLIFLLFIFIVVLEILVRRYAFVYKKPLLASVLGIIALILVGGFFIAITPLHYELLSSARHGGPPPLNLIYRGPFRGPPPPDTLHGEIVNFMQGGFVVAEDDSNATETVFITPQTRLPYGDDFATGTRVVVIGDPAGQNAMRAFGVSQIDAYPTQ
jgi:hypothetical protein